MMIRVVLDTNVYIASVFWKGVPHEVVIRGLGGAFLVVISFSLLEEIGETLTRKFNFPRQDTHALLEVITLNAYVVEPAIKVSVVERDPSDNKVIECAIAGKAEYIVSGDKDLLTLEQYKGIKIVKPVEFLARIKD